ncbi:hypothetical protein I350_01318 [Cryptococcus amylolentus CBS 6273]|uniref:Uncharacterized protein n=1 Tax=Cryptococcus amylolentus CBS 6273 TaxID=1296118 RepID=A0A1E3KC92_9TREE|nr:hypothetical protein I350_01318 [Cryptococcus amylolentus CBS 6273]
MGIRQAEVGGAVNILEEMFGRHLRHGQGWGKNGGSVEDGPNSLWVWEVASHIKFAFGCREELELVGKRSFCSIAASHVVELKEVFKVVLMGHAEFVSRLVAVDIEAQEVAHQTKV